MKPLFDSFTMTHLWKWCENHSRDTRAAFDAMLGWLAKSGDAHYWAEKGWQATADAMLADGINVYALGIQQ